MWIEEKCLSSYFDICWQTLVSWMSFETLDETLTEEVFLSEETRGDFVHCFLGETHSRMCLEIKESCFRQMLNNYTFVYLKKKNLT